MTVTPDDSARLQRLGIVVLINLAELLTLTLLYGKDVTIYPVDALTWQLWLFHIRHIHNGLLHCSIHHHVCTTCLHRWFYPRSNSRCRRRGLKYRPTLAVFILIILSFTFATIYWATWVAFLSIQIRWALVKNVGMELSEKWALTNAALAKPLLIQTIFFPFMVS